MSDYLSLFFSQTYEKSINKKMMYYEYVLPKDAIIEYILQINRIDIALFLEYISQSDSIDISSKDIFQFSSFTDCTERLCKELISIDNPGVTHCSAGKLLLNDGTKRNDIAYTKYGENHLKTAEALGLTFSVTNTFFLSCIGMVWLDLSPSEQYDFLVRSILRSKLIFRMIQASQNGRVDVRQFLYMISDKTYTRRRSNIKRIVNILVDYKDYNFLDITSNFDF